MAKDEGGKYFCEKHGRHNGMQVGIRWTASCPVCILEKRGRKIKEARARKTARAEGVTINSVTASELVCHMPRDDEKSRIVELDFTDYPEVLSELKDAAVLDFRDLNRQAIYLINWALELRGKEAA